MQQTINELSKRVGFFIAVYICLLVLINLTGFKTVYHQHFINMSNAVFSSFNNGGLVTFKDGPKANKQKYKANDCLIILTSQQQKKRAVAKARETGSTKANYNPISFNLNSWHHFGILITFFLGLIISLPLSWQRKLFTFTIGYVFIQLFFYVKMWASLNLKFSVWYEQFQVGWTNDFFIDMLNYFHIIIMYPFFGLVLITLISLLLNGNTLAELKMKFA